MRRGTRTRNEPPILLPLTTGRGLPRRERTKSNERSNGPTRRRATAPAGTTESGPESVNGRTDTPVAGLARPALGTGAGASVALPARSRTWTVKA